MDNNTPNLAVGFFHIPHLSSFYSLYMRWLSSSSNLPSSSINQYYYYYYYYYQAIILHYQYYWVIVARIFQVIVPTPRRYEFFSGRKTGEISLCTFYIVSLYHQIIVNNWYVRLWLSLPIIKPDILLSARRAHFIFT